MSEYTSPDDLLPLTPAVFHILLALSEGKKHGYAIMQDVEEITGGRLAMGPGTLYGSIKRMLQSKLIEETKAPHHDDDPRRRYYRLTDFGSHVANAEARRLAALVRIARKRSLLLKQS